MVFWLSWLVLIFGWYDLAGVTAIQTGTTTGEKALWGIVISFVAARRIICYIVKSGSLPLLLVIAGWVLMMVGGGTAAFSGAYPTTP